MASTCTATKDEVLPGLAAYPLETFTEDDCYHLPSVTYHMSAKGVAYTTG